MCFMCVSFVFRVCSACVPCLFHMCFVCVSFVLRVCFTCVPCVFHVCASFVFHVCFVCAYVAVSVCAFTDYRRIMCTAIPTHTLFTGND